ncbi:glycosyltransferase family 39 protein [Polaribacter sp. Hel1_85]|uniref:glycosyltransferase family 39 protein n=1 Tax=Polaribacter sp. Hel1_85 TaxID=1250005 RepID=UPI00052E3886|nr:glycosyltransferase family 39 protein [Polaribacter sp. Hel1_85]KGL61730.1 glycosyltransferase, GTnc family [Polaribacter sp. Hel1_85]
MNKHTKFVIFAFCIVKLALHLVADSNSGFQGDELLHIETGNHLAFGFMEFPPLIGLLAFIQNLFQSESVFVHHIFSHIAAILILIFVSKIVVELGGKTKSVFIVLLCIIVAPAFGRTQQLFQPVIFGQLFWVVNFFFLTKYIKNLDQKYLWLLTIGAALAFLTKYDAVFFIFGVSSLLFFKSTRKALLKHGFWWNIIAFILLISPNIIWQIVNDFPVLKMFNRLYETQLDKQTYFEVLQDFFMALNPLTLPISVAAVISTFHYSMKAYRPLILSILLSAIFLVFSEGKAYYFYPIALTILPFGGIFWENIILAKRKWLMYPIAIILFVGVLLIPFGMPVFKLETYLKNDYAYENREVVNGGQFNVRFNERYSKEKWAITLKELENVYDSIPDKEKENTIIWGKHYAQTGAVNLFKEQYNLPKAYSLHGSFYNWVPKGEMPNVTIALSYNSGDFFQGYFDEVVKVKIIYNPYSENEEELYQFIYICKKPKQSFDELKELFKNRIFE